MRPMSLRDDLEPLLEEKRVHITEFRALAQAQMELLLAERNPDAARSCLNLWSELEGEEEPSVVYWRRRIDGRIDRPRPDEMDEVIRDFLRREGRRP